MILDVTFQEVTQGFSVGFGTPTPQPCGVLYTPQSLNEEQKAQARENIGVGATVAEKQYELIEVITLTEDTAQLTRTADPNGVPYDFSAVRVFVDTPAYDGAKTSWQLIFALRNADNNAMVYQQVGEALDAKKTTLVARNDRGMVDYYYASASGSIGGIIKAKPLTLTEPWRNVSKINLTKHPSDVVILAGTKITIYAVRG